MEALKVFDAYSLRARLFPAVIAAAPAFAALALLISWTTFGLSNVVASLGILVLLFAVADFARQRGRSIEQRLHSELGGLPSITMFRRSDLTLDEGSKDRYRALLAGKLGKPAPTAEQELADLGAADTFYRECGAWLRENTRDTKKFSVLFTENVTYGFRRNLLGVKRVALGLNLLVVAVCVLLLWRSGWSIQDDHGKRVLVVLIVAAAHGAYMLLAVNRSAVADASRAYGRQLILSCETFLAPAPAAKKTAKPTKTKKEDTAQ